MVFLKGDPLIKNCVDKRFGKKVGYGRLHGALAYSWTTWPKLVGLKLPVYRLPDLHSHAHQPTLSSLRIVSRFW